MVKTLKLARAGGKEVFLCFDRQRLLILMRESLSQSISTACFAKHQPFSAPNDLRHYFVTPQESGELCLMSCLLVENRDIFFPNLNEKLHLITFSEIAVSYLRYLGYEPFECSSEDVARDRTSELIVKKQWPCWAKKEIVELFFDILPEFAHKETGKYLDQRM